MALIETYTLGFSVAAGSTSSLQTLLLLVERTGVRRERTTRSCNSLSNSRISPEQTVVRRF
jgi:hypothetical protein